MDSSSNGSHPHEEHVSESSNPYAEVIAGDRPTELARYDLNTDPYANVIPNPGRMVVDDGDTTWDGTRRRRNPWMIAISLGLVAILVLPVMAEVFSRLFH